MSKIEKAEELARRGATAGERAAAQAAIERLRSREKELGSDYTRWVKEGKAAVEKQESCNWELGELASKVATKHGESTLRHYADDVGVNYNTLKAYHATFQAWPQKVTRVTSWKACQALNAVPSRHQIAEKNPDMTVREAREISERNSAASPKSRISEIKKTERRAERAMRKRDAVSPRFEVVEILQNMLHKNGNVYELLHSVDFRDVFGAATRKKILQELHALRSRVDAEIARLESGDKLTTSKENE